ncbi:hypothetical protein FGO68_gene11259 [Halteria grandinella]|uniref:Uncharacterized protein n=1 Tax=Halteria grandinella TaxID=5974 RepID=A0A8J8SZC4_HALGN|nr:hypothetical protein FGO68_gene11259 [Halteria grandinella]
MSNKQGAGQSSTADDSLENIDFQILPNKDGPTKKQDYLFKMIIIGNSGVGKSCLMNRMTTNEFTEDHEVTVGVEFGSLLIKMQEKTEAQQETVVKLQIWDTAGQESFQSITKIFYRGAHAVLLTYSIASQLSFSNLSHWLAEVRQQSEADAVIVLVGNQKDRESEREVSREAGEKFAKENNIDFFFETSAKTSDGVQQTFIMASKMLYRRHLSKIRQAKKQMQDKIRGRKLQQQQDNKDAQERKKNCGC